MGSIWLLGQAPVSSPLRLFCICWADLSGGFDLLETEDPKKLAEFAYRWSDLMDLEITPVLEDQEMAQALQNAIAASNAR